MRELTQEDIDHQYSALQDSIDLINQLINGTGNHNLEPQDKKDAIKRNVEHLELMVSKDHWADRNMQPSIDTIAIGNTWLTNNA